MDLVVGTDCSACACGQDGTANRSSTACRTVASNSPLPWLIWDNGGGNADNLGITIVHRGKAKRLDAEGLGLIKRRNAIERVIGAPQGRLRNGLLPSEVRDRRQAVCSGLQHSVAAAGYRPQGPDSPFASVAGVVMACTTDQRLKMAILRSSYLVAIA
jgi:hypothetical protein